MEKFIQDLEEVILDIRERISEDEDWKIRVLDHFLLDRKNNCPIECKRISLKIGFLSVLYAIQEKIDNEFLVSQVTMTHENYRKYDDIPWEWKKEIVIL